MSPKKKVSKLTKVPHSDTPTSDPARTTTYLGRDGLGAYIVSPDAFPASRVIYHDEKWVVINDLFPKSSVHVLLLPRNPAKQLLHPFDAFDDQDFLKEVQEQVRKWRLLVAKELQRRYGKYSALDQERRKAIDALDGDPSDIESAQLPPGRDWSQSVISGIHAGPSMNHLHVHILSIDRHSECMKHKKHYNSFSTPFLIDVDDFPLGKDDVKRQAAREGYLKWDMKCWKCERNFGNKFAKLKEHLSEEFEEWKKQ
jgi:aprataxin